MRRRGLSDGGGKLFLRSLLRMNFDIKAVSAIKTAIPENNGVLVFTPTAKTARLIVTAHIANTSLLKLRLISFPLFSSR